MGEGRNAVYLAAQGWHVTGVDFAAEGIQQARTAATARGVSEALDAIDADLNTWNYGTAKYDLVALIYAFPALDRMADVQRAVKPGGIVVYEYFSRDKDQPDAPAPGELAKEFGAGWQIVRDDIVDDAPDWGPDRARLERFVARKL